MRDTLIGAAFLAAIVGAFWFFQRSGSDATVTGFTQPSPIASAAPTAEPHASAPEQLAQAPSRPAKKLQRKGIRHERRNSEPSEQTARLGNDEAKGEGSAAEPQQAESLPSLYSGSSAEPKAAVSKNWHGVPVTAWLESRRSALPRPPVSGEAPSDLRLFFQCMELKKDGPREVAERECRKLRAGLPSDELARQNGLPVNTGTTIY